MTRRQKWSRKVSCWQCDELKEPSVSGGVLTPAFAFRDNYIDRLREVGLVVDAS